MLGRLADDLIKAGVHGLTPLGSTGEFAYLSREQRAAVVQATIEAADKRVPVIAGVASTSTADAGGDPVPPQAALTAEERQAVAAILAGVAKLEIP